MTALKCIFRYNSMGCAHMPFEPESIAHTLSADFTFNSFVHVIFVSFQSMWSTKGTITLITLFWSTVFMLHFNVFLQSVFACESFCTEMTLVCSMWIGRFRQYSLMEFSLM